MRFSSIVARWRVATAVALVVLAVGAYLAFSGDRAASETLAVTRGDSPIEVSVAGTVVAAQDADLGFAESGRILSTYAAVGTHVTAGTVLAETENGDEVAAVAKAQAALDEARANLAATRAGTRPEEVAIDQAAVAAAQTVLIQSIQSAYDTADDAVRNRADLIFSNPESGPQLKYPHFWALKDTLEQERTAISPMLAEWRDSLATLSPQTVESVAAKAGQDLSYIANFLDNANAALNQATPETISAATLATDAASIATGRANVASAAASVTSDLSTLTSAEKTLALAQAGPTEEDVASGEASVAGAAADLANAQAALAKTRVVAPFSGIVTRMDAKAGEVVSPSTSEIAMQSDGTYEIEVYIPEIAIANIAVGEAATTTLDAYGADVPFAASVISVDPAETVKDGVPTYKTTLAFAQDDPRIRSGMTANVLITTGILKDAVVIPLGAVGHDSAGAYVSVRTGSKVEHRAVTTGASAALGEVEITAGLSPGDVILLAPAS